MFPLTKEGRRDGDIRVPLLVLLLLTSLAHASSLEHTVVRDAIGNDKLLHELLHATEPTLINFWATWCPPCREELPLLLAGYQNGDYQLITINIGDPIEKTQTYLNQNGVAALPNYFLRARQAAGLPIFGMPTSLLVSPAGHVIATHPGAFSTETLQDFTSDRSETR